MRQGLLLAVALATGAAVMVIELMAVRLMAPWFGMSLLVWTNVIGVVLAALAVGQWLGGRWAEAGRAFQPAALLCVAGALAVALPDVVRLISPLALPSDLTLEEAYPFVTAGSLLVATLAVGVPMAALGAVTPWLVRLSRDASRIPGRVSGAIIGAGTLGSLLGTFGATHLLLGLLGAAGSVRCAGLLLVLAGLVMAPAGRRPVRATLGSALLSAALLAWPERPRDPALLEMVDTPYQLARVELEPDGTRLLRINEGLDSFHSAYVPGQLWTGRYFDAFLLPALLAPPDPDGVRRVLVVGLGGGTMARQIREVDPSIEVSGIELDPELVRLGRLWFGLPDEVAVEAGRDARVVLRCDRTLRGAILLDAYAQQIYLPQHLCTREFFELVRARLVPGGVAALNLGGITRDDPVVAAVAGTFAAVFPGASMARVPGTRNMIVLGWNGASPSAATAAARLVAAGVLEHLRWMVEDDLFAPVGAGPLLLDGDAPVEALAHASWRSRS